MKRFLITFTTALATFVGCQMPDLASKSPEQTPEHWAPIISSAAGLALPQVVVVPDPSPINKPKRSNCPECKGTGKVRTGDGISWTECDTCVPDVALASLEDHQYAELAALRAYKTAMEAWLTKKGYRNKVDPFAVTSKLDANPSSASGTVPAGSVLSPSESAGYYTYTVCGPNGCQTVRQSTGMQTVAPQRRGLFGWRRW